MDNTYFRAEITNYINSRYDKFCEYQKIAFEILVEFDRVCRKNNLDYYLAFGSLLGAVRDNNQIPWDYDIDTLVRIDKKQELLTALKTDLSTSYYYDYIDVNPTYPASCIRVCKKGFSMMALHVDVFFLVGTPNDEKKRINFYNRIQKVINFRSFRFLHYYSNSKPSNRFVKSYICLKRTLFSFVSNTLINRFEDRLMRMYPLEESSYWFACQEVYKKGYPNKIFESSTTVTLNGFQIMIPVGYEEFLSINYGNWKSYLPTQKRFEEFYNMTNKLDERQDIFTTGSHE